MHINHLLINIVTNFLANDISSSEQLTITCPDRESGSILFSGWSLSPDGLTQTIMIDTSSESSKYVINGLSLSINNITGTDEGLYRCIYNQGISRASCIFVYGKFAIILKAHHA